jgi:putative transposase
MRIIAYCLMPNHWHLLLWPEGDRDLSRFLHWLETTHASHHRRQTHTIGQGAVYQSRFTAIPVTDVLHFLTVCRYVERNPLAADLVARAEEWRWSSAAQRAGADTDLPMDDGPMPLPVGWLALVNQGLDLLTSDPAMAL